MSLATLSNNGRAADSMQQVESRRQRETRVVEDNGPLAYLFDTARFEHMQRIATTMAHSAFTPKHLKGASQEETLANCIRVTLQAIRWGFDPFAVADETYVVQGRLGYQGKLVASVINARAGLAERLNCSFAGTGENREVTISGRFEGEKQARTVTLTVIQGKTQNQMWTKDPDQKLFYSGVVKWGRRHCQEVIMGVLTDDDVETATQTARIEAAPVLPSGPAGSADALQARVDAGRKAKAEQLHPPTIDAEPIDPRIAEQKARLEAAESGESQLPADLENESNNEAEFPRADESQASDTPTTWAELTPAVYAIAEQRGADPDQVGEAFKGLIIAVGKRGKEDQISTEKITRWYADAVSGSGKFSFMTPK